MDLSPLNLITKRKPVVAVALRPTWPCLKANGGIAGDETCRNVSIDILGYLSFRLRSGNFAKRVSQRIHRYFRLPLKE